MLPPCSSPPSDRYHIQAQSSMLLLGKATLLLSNLPPPILTPYFFLLLLHSTGVAVFEKKKEKKEKGNGKPRSLAKETSLQSATPKLPRKMPPTKIQAMPQIKEHFYTHSPSSASSTFQLSCPPRPARSLSTLLGLIFTLPCFSSRHLTSPPPSYIPSLHPRPSPPPPQALSPPPIKHISQLFRMFHALFLHHPRQSQSTPYHHTLPLLRCPLSIISCELGKFFFLLCCCHGHKA
jgi:hypothetical protein